MTVRIQYDDAEFSPEEYLRAYHAALDYLRKSSRGKVLINTVESASKASTIRIGAKSDFGSNFYSERDEIAWNPNIQLSIKVSGKAYAISPALSLLHEIGHAVQWIEDAGWYTANATGELYLKIEDENVAKNESVAAVQLGEPRRAKYADNNGTRPFLGQAGKLPLHERVLVNDGMKGGFTPLPGNFNTVA